MDLAAATAAAGGGGPAPFLLKTYDMVNDSSTDNIVSWSELNNSFVVWDPPEFARTLLPAFLSIVTSPALFGSLILMVFARLILRNGSFSMKNIHRRKPIHSHSNPQGSAIDPERAAFEEEIEGLTCEKSEYEAKIMKYEEEHSSVKFHLDTLTNRVGGLEQRQQHLLAFLEKTIRNPTFVDQLSKKIDSVEFSEYSKKRRLQYSESHLPITDSSFADNHSSSGPDIGQIFHQDFSNKLNLDLSLCVTDTHLVSHSTQSSNEDGESSQRVLSEGTQRDARLRKECAFFFPEATELSDTGMSLSYNMNTGLPSETVATIRNVSLKTTEDGDDLGACHLFLSLASSNTNQLVAKPAPLNPEHPATSESRSNEKDTPHHNTNIISSSPQVIQSNNVACPAAPQPRVNDAFWEQYLTERPGCSDNEEASSELSIKLV